MSQVGEAEQLYQRDPEFRAFVTDVVRAARQHGFADAYSIGLAATAAVVCVLAEESEPREGAD